MGDRDAVRVGGGYGFHFATWKVSIAQGAFRRRLGGQLVERVVSIIDRAVGGGGGEVLAGGRVGEADGRLAGGGAGEQAVEGVVGVGGDGAVEVGELVEISGSVVGAGLGVGLVGQNLEGQLVEGVEGVGGDVSP